MCIRDSAWVVFIALPSSGSGGVINLHRPIARVNGWAKLGDGQIREADILHVEHDARAAVVDGVFDDFLDVEAEAAGRAGVIAAQAHEQDAGVLQPHLACLLYTSRCV